MGCGPAYLSGYAVGAGANLAPYWFGPRPDPARPAPQQERFLIGAQPSAHSDASSFFVRYRSYQPVASDHRLRPRDPFATVRPLRVVDDDGVPQGWRSGNIYAARAYPYPLAQDQRLFDGCPMF